MEQIIILIPPWATFVYPKSFIWHSSNPDEFIKLENPIKFKLPTV